MGRLRAFFGNWGEFTFNMSASLNSLRPFQKVRPLPPTPPRSPTAPVTSCWIAWAFSSITMEQPVSCANFFRALSAIDCPPGHLPFLLQTLGLFRPGDAGGGNLGQHIRPQLQVTYIIQQLPLFQPLAACTARWSYRTRPC